MDLNMLLAPFVKLRVTIVMRSGARHVFLCDKINTVRGEMGLTRMAWEGAKRPPHFIELTNVDLVLTKTVSRWHAYG